MSLGFFRKLIRLVYSPGPGTTRMHTDRTGYVAHIVIYTQKWKDLLLILVPV